MEWVRGEIIGRGTFGTVNLAILTKSTTKQNSFVIKSSHISNFSSLKNEKQVLIELGNNYHHNNIVRFLGDSVSEENGYRLYNLFLEYAPKGSLLDHLRKSAGRFIISDVKSYTRDILKGLSHVHEKGFVHSDVKLENILIFHDNDVKLADFGLARRVTDGNSECELIRGTPLYLSPELLACGKVTTAIDIWAVGCAVVEMVTGKSAWECSPENDISGLFYRIGVCGECPKIPKSLCDDGKDFLSKCFLKDPNSRWTARMLLEHPFLCLGNGYDRELIEKGSVSPTCPFELPSWESTETSSFESGLFNSIGSGYYTEECDISCWVTFSSRLESFKGEFVSEWKPYWSDLDGWITIR